MAYKVLNLYAGIGGNRKLWTDCEVTAVEINESIANVYSKNYPNDTVIVADAHKYLLNHYSEFDFIWSSPPCQSHSRVRKAAVNRSIGKMKQIYPDMKLWQEILFLQNQNYTKFCIENVTPYYDIFLKPSIKIGRHYFWSNFKIPTNAILEQSKKEKNLENITGTENHYGFNIKNESLGTRKDQILRNLVDPKIGEYIYNCFLKSQQKHKLL